MSRRKIPTGRDALGKMLYLIVNDNKLKSDASLTIADEILDIWRNIHKDSNLHNKSYVSRKLKKLHTAYTKVKANVNRKNDKESKRKVDFIKQLDSNFVICKTKSVLPADGTVNNKENKKRLLPVDDELLSGDSFSEEDLDYKLPKPQRKSKLKITTQLVASVDHAGLSSRNAANVILSTAHYLDIDPKDVVVSPSTIYRQRRSIRRHIRDKIHILRKYH